ncbi:MAG: Fe-S cluster assembly ATPase SufC [Leptospiraceae bacterium]|nr:Fe-S cluster assembly ATPase SufC [Leptospiraceae bacterium]MDW7976553.1 Fe-S cluster assembly ATPase SufC [Leptospiraceae bacterium]
MSYLLEIEDLHVEVEGKEILKGINLKVPYGEIHAIMGPNGSGKSTLSYTLLGHKNYVVTKGDIKFEGESILSLPTHERARKGIFLSLQHPTQIPGVSTMDFLRNVMKSFHPQLTLREIHERIQKGFEKLQMRKEFLTRYVNDGFSGGEKKRNEILQMYLIQPKFAILDEIDSGLDIDALKIISENIQSMKSPERSMILITHYQRLLNYIEVDRVHILFDGQIQFSGGKELAERLEQEGYEGILSIVKK